MDSHSPRPYPFTDPDLVKKYIQELAKGGSQKAFKGVPELIEAIDQGMIWKGDIIFGTSTFSHYKGKSQWKEVLSDKMAPLVHKLVTGNWRKYTFLHVAVYAGYVQRCTDCKLHYTKRNAGFTKTCPNCDKVIMKLKLVIYLPK